MPTWSHAGHVLGKQQHNKFAQSTHARRTARASSIDEKGLIVKSKATSARPRAGTTGIILYYVIFYFTLIKTKFHQIELYYITSFYITLN